MRYHSLCRISLGQKLGTPIENVLNEVDDTMAGPASGWCDMTCSPEARRPDPGSAVRLRFCWQSDALEDQVHRQQEILA